MLRYIISNRSVTVKQLMLRPIGYDINELHSSKIVTADRKKRCLLTQKAEGEM